MAARCRDAGCESVDLNLPCDHPLVGRLAPHGHRGVNTTGMVRVIDLAGMLEALRPELEERSRSLAAPVRVRLESPVAAASIAAEPGSVSIDNGSAASRARFTPAGLGSMLLGFLPVSELAAAGEIEAEPATMEALDVLFPDLHSHYWQIDHF